MQAHNEASKQSHANAEELTNFRYSTTQTTERYEDSPIWITSADGRHIAHIGKQIVIERGTRAEVEEELKNPTIKTWSLIAAIMAERVYQQMKLEDKDI